MQGRALGLGGGASEHELWCRKESLEVLLWRDRRTDRHSCVGPTTAAPWEPPHPEGPDLGLVGGIGTSGVARFLLSDTGSPHINPAEDAHRPPVLRR